MIKRCVILFFILLIFSPVYSQSKDEEQNLITLDFRNQKVTDIIMSLSELCGKSVSMDETVKGTATFHFENVSFDTALQSFAKKYSLYVTKVDDVYNISKVNITYEDGACNVNAENVMVEPLIKALSKETDCTILYDILPSVDISLRLKNCSIEEVLNLVLTKLPGFSLEIVGKGYYLTKSSSRTTTRNIDDFTINTKDGLFSIRLKKASLAGVIDQLFKKGGHEYSLLNKNSVTLENLFYENKNFDDLLHLIMEQSNSDYVVINNIYYILEIQRKDVLKNLKETKVIPLKNISVDLLQSLFPSELNAAAFVKSDKDSNAVFVTGTNDEIAPILKFIETVDVASVDRYHRVFTLVNINVKDALALIPQSLFYTTPVVSPNGESFIALVNKQTEEQIEKYISLIDKKSSVKPVRLRFIRSDDLLKYLPPSVSADNISVTTDSSLIFFKGREESYNNFLKELRLIDQPKQQIRYQLLVIQHQKTDGINWTPSFSFTNTAATQSATTFDYTTTLSSLLNVDFDVISQFGHQFASNLNYELSAGVAHVLADTTLNGISGEAISFSNTNTYRYRDIIVDNDGDIYSSTTREISSGLVLSINGWVSGDNMITVNVDAQVSKQGSAETSSSSTTETTNPPSTSEKKVSTNVRTKTGSPVIISGLLQTETDDTTKKIPLFSSIPLVGRLFKTVVKSTAETELSIYLVPFVEPSGNNEVDYNIKTRLLYQKYIGGALQNED